MREAVSPEYRERLEHLAQTLVIERRFSPLVVQCVQLELEIPDNIIQGEE